MQAKTIARLQRFVGKVCSVISSPINRHFEEMIAREHFVVRVDEINPDGIWGAHPYNPDLVSFFALPHVVSVHEEVELNPNNPEHKRMIEEYEERTGKKLHSDLKGEPTETPSQEESEEGGMAFVDIESLEKLAEQTKRTFDARDRLSK